MRETEQRVTALLNNEIQIAQFIPPHLYETVANSPNHKVVPTDSIEIMFLAMQPKPPFDKKEVRQAVCYAIDKDKIIKTLLQGRATRLDAPLGPLGGNDFVATAPRDSRVTPGAVARLRIPQDKIHLFDSESGLRI